MGRKVIMFIVSSNFHCDGRIQAHEQGKRDVMTQTGGT